MSGLVDLHLHSTFSDGVLTPSELVREASRIGLRAIAVADHDNIDGVPEALVAGVRCGVEVVSSVELSVVWKDLQDLHLLGYAFDHTNSSLQSALADFREYRAGRSLKILERVNSCLDEKGLRPLAVDEVTSRAGGTIGRPHIGQALLAAGYVSDMDQAFDEYLVPCNVTKRYFPIADAIGLIHAAGGCAVLAHPVFLPLDDAGMLELMGSFKALGLDGLEAYTGGGSNQSIDRFITLARRMQLIVTGGSDFHQPQPGGVTIGVGRGNLKIPYRCVMEIREAAERYP